MDTTNEKRDSLSLMDTINEKRDSLSVLLAVLPLLARFIAWLLSGATINVVSCIELSFCCITLCFTDISYIEKQAESVTNTNKDKAKYINTLFRTLYWGTICCALITLGITYLDETSIDPPSNQEIAFFIVNRKIALFIAIPLAILPFFFKVLYKSIIIKLNKKWISPQ